MSCSLVGIHSGSIPEAGANLKTKNKMRTIEKTVYKFSELSDSAKQKALNNYCYSTEFYWSDDYLRTIRYALNYFDIELKNYSIDWGNTSWNVRISEHNNSELSGVRLYKYLNNRYNVELLKNECKFTGFCADIDFMEPIYRFLQRPCKYTNLQEILNYCVDSVISAGCKDYEYQLSEESFSEMCEAYEWEFYENGNRF